MEKSNQTHKHEKNKKTNKQKKHPTMYCNPVAHARQELMSDCSVQMYNGDYKLWNKSAYSCLDKGIAQVHNHPPTVQKGVDQF